MVLPHCRANDCKRCTREMRRAPLLTFVLVPISEKAVGSALMRRRPTFIGTGGRVLIGTLAWFQMKYELGTFRSHCANRLFSGG